ncbi:MAG TPA: hypothetical protein VFU31_05110 [Candidatus Binatia bacterium]|nr:hypothetical protein [Candidatus Binatia bacterium]
MSSCNHTRLELLPDRKKKLRCRHCHLVIEGEELGDGCCPECLDRSGKKRYDFEEMETSDERTVRYRCEECGAIVKSA